MGDSSLQTTQYESDRRMYESAFNCNAEVHGMYLDKSRSGLGRLKLPFLKLANDLRDSALIRKVHARLRRMADKVDGIDHKVDDMHYKVNDIRTILSNLDKSGTRPVSDTLARQEMPL